jgi:hypothetical protein
MGVEQIAFHSKFLATSESARDLLVAGESQSASASGRAVAAMPDINPNGLTAWMIRNSFHPKSMVFR